MELIKRHIRRGLDQNLAKDLGHWLCPNAFLKVSGKHKGKNPFTVSSQVGPDPRLAPVNSGRGTPGFHGY